MEPETEEETPDYIINTPSELEALAARLEAQLEEEELAFALKYCPYIFFDKKGTHSPTQDRVPGFYFHKSQRFLPQDCPGEKRRNGD